MYSIKNCRHSLHLCPRWNSFVSYSGRRPGGLDRCTSHDSYHCHVAHRQNHSDHGSQTGRSHSHFRRHHLGGFRPVARPASNCTVRGLPVEYSHPSARSIRYFHLPSERFLERNYRTDGEPSNRPNGNHPWRIHVHETCRTAIHSLVPTERQIASGVMYSECFYFMM